MPGTLRERLQVALPAAVKTRDRTAVTVLRATLAEPAAWPAAPPGDRGGRGADAGGVTR